MAVIDIIRSFDRFCRLKHSWTLICRFVNEISCYHPGGHRRNISCLSSYTGCRLHVDGCLWSSTSYVTENARAKISNAPLTLIFKMKQGACLILYLLSRQPILHLWLSATNHHSDFQRWKINNCWRSVDAHFQDGAGSVLLFFLPIMAANTLIMYNHDQMNF